MDLASLSLSYSALPLGLLDDGKYFRLLCHDDITQTFQHPIRSTAAVCTKNLRDAIICIIMRPLLRLSVLPFNPLAALLGQQRAPTPTSAAMLRIHYCLLLRPSCFLSVLNLKKRDGTADRQQDVRNTKLKTSTIDIRVSVSTIYIYTAYVCMYSGKYVPVRRNQFALTFCHELLCLFVRIFSCGVVYSSSVASCTSKYVHTAAVPAVRTCSKLLCYIL